MDLSSFRNKEYSAGRGLLAQIAWFFIGLPIVRSQLIPLSFVKVICVRLFGATVGGNVVIKPGVRIKYPWRLSVGDNSWIGEDCWIDNLADVTIEDNVCISQGSYVCTGNHDWSDRAFALRVRPITIHCGAWVGAKAVLTPGVELGECAVAAAGSVVTRSIPPYEIYAGNPARFVRKRSFSPRATDEAGNNSLVENTTI